MKYLQILLITGFGLFLGNAVMAQKSNVDFEINHETTMADLAKIKTDMLDHGAYFQMTDLEFDDEGFVEKISINVNFNDGFKGSASMSEFDEKKKLRIIRNYDKEGDEAFCLGECN